MHRIAERHAARASIVLFALLVALGAAMCVRVHGTRAQPGAQAASDPPVPAPARAAGARSASAVTPR